MTSPIEFTSLPQEVADRRQHDRKLFHTTAQLLLPNHRVVEARTLDISPQGLGVVSPLNLPHNLTCIIRLSMPKTPSGHEVITMQGRVCYCVLSGAQQGFVIGLQFTSVPDASARAIKRFTGLDGAPPKDKDAAAKEAQPQESLKLAGSLESDDPLDLF